jgi:hypothetical protein
MRYQTVKILIEGGHITTFRDIFLHIPKSIVAIDFGSNYHRFSRKLQAPSGFKLKDIYLLAHLFEIDKEVMLKLVMSEINSKGKK